MSCWRSSPNQILDQRLASQSHKLVSSIRASFSSSPKVLLLVCEAAGCFIGNSRTYSINKCTFGCSEQPVRAGRRGDWRCVLHQRSPGKQQLHLLLVLRHGGHGFEASWPWVICSRLPVWIGCFVTTSARFISQCSAWCVLTLHKNHAVFCASMFVPEISTFSGSQRSSRTNRQCAQQLGVEEPEVDLMLPRKCFENTERKKELQNDTRVHRQTESATAVIDASGFCWFPLLGLCLPSDQNPCSVLNKTRRTP